MLIKKAGPRAADTGRETSSVKSTSPRRRRQGSAQFGKVPYNVIASGGIARLGRSDLAVYLAISAHVDGDNWSANPSVPTIARLAGASESTVRRAVQRLSDAGLMKVQVGGGRKNTNIYTLTLNPVTNDATLSELNPFTQDEGVLAGNPVILRRKPCQNRP